MDFNLNSYCYFPFLWRTCVYVLMIISPISLTVRETKEESGDDAPCSAHSSQSQRWTRSIRLQWLFFLFTFSTPTPPFLYFPPTLQWFVYLLPLTVDALYLSGLTVFVIFTHWHSIIIYSAVSSRAVFPQFPPVDSRRLFFLVNFALKTASFLEATDIFVTWTSIPLSVKAVFLVCPVSPALFPLDICFAFVP